MASIIVGMVQNKTRALPVVSVFLKEYKGMRTKSMRPTEQNHGPNREISQMAVLRGLWPTLVGIEYLPRKFPSLVKAHLCKHQCPRKSMMIFHLGTSTNKVQKNIDGSTSNLTRRIFDFERKAKISAKMICLSKSSSKSLQLSPY